MIVLSVLKRPENIDVPDMNNKKMAQDLRDLAERLGIDLSQANKEMTTKILKQFGSLSEEIIKLRKDVNE